MNEPIAAIVPKLGRVRSAGRRAVVPPGLWQRLIVGSIAAHCGVVALVASYRVREAHPVAASVGDRSGAIAIEVIASDSNSAPNDDTGNTAAPPEFSPPLSASLIAPASASRLGERNAIAPITAPIATPPSTPPTTTPAPIATPTANPPATPPIVTPLPSAAPTPTPQVNSGDDSEPSDADSGSRLESGKDGGTDLDVNTNPRSGDDSDRRPPDDGRPDTGEPDRSGADLDKSPDTTSPDTEVSDGSDRLGLTVRLTPLPSPNPDPDRRPAQLIAPAADLDMPVTVDRALLPGDVAPPAAIALQVELSIDPNGQPSLVRVLVGDRERPQFEPFVAALLSDWRFTAASSTANGLEVDQLDLAVTLQWQ